MKTIKLVLSGIVFLMFLNLRGKIIQEKYFSIDLPENYKLIKIKDPVNMTFLEMIAYQVINDKKGKVINITIYLDGGVAYLSAPLKKYVKETINGENYYYLKTKIKGQYVQCLRIDSSSDFQFNAAMESKVENEELNKIFNSIRIKKIKNAN